MPRVEDEYGMLLESLGVSYRTLMIRSEACASVTDAIAELSYEKAQRDELLRRKTLPAREQLTFDYTQGHTDDFKP